jgi:hypothetical protein
MGLMGGRRFARIVCAFPAAPDYSIISSSTAMIRDAKCSRSDKESQKSSPSGRIGPSVLFSCDADLDDVGSSALQGIPTHKGSH